MITFLLIFAYAYVILLALCTSIAIFGVKLGNKDNTLAQKLYEGDGLLNFLIFRFFIHEKPHSFKKCYSSFMWELSGKIILPVIFITVDNMKSPSVLRSGLTVTLFLLVYILICHKCIKMKSKDFALMIFPLLAVVMAMIQSVLENKENTPHTWLILWISLTMLLILTWNIMCINGVLKFMKNPYVKFVLFIIVILGTLVLISWTFGSYYVRFPDYFVYGDMKSPGKLNQTVTPILWFYLGIKPFFGDFSVNLKHANDYIAYLPVLEKVMGYIYPPIFIVFLINGGLMGEDNDDTKYNKQN
ncbi:MAG: hypothetical protein ABF651_01665 [Sporolactobacillus sp.]